jgi:hypothetical protein
MLIPRSSLGKILDIPIYCTTQNAARLGATVSELRENFPEGTKEVDKTAFSMVWLSFLGLALAFLLLPLPAFPPVSRTRAF